MTPITFEQATGEPILADSDVEVRVADLIGRACERQLWLLFIDARGVQLRELVPIAGYPISPAGNNAEQLAGLIADVMGGMGAEQVVFVWERGLSEIPTPADRIWAKALGAACRAKGVTVRAQLISHRKGVRWFPPADYE